MPDTDNDPPDLYSLYADQQMPADRLRALATALRRRREAGVFATLTGDPAVAAVGRDFMEGAQHGEDQMAGGGKFQRQQALEAAERGPQPALGGISPAAYNALTSRLGLTRPETEVNPVTGGYYNRRGPIPQGNGGPASPFDKRLPGMMDALKKDLDPNSFRSGVLKGNQERINAVQRILTLAEMPDGSVRDLNPSAMSELSSSFAALLGGGTSGEGTRREFTPYTKGRSLAEVEQWLTDAPHGTGQRAFVSQLVDSAKRELGVAQDSIRKAQAQRLPAHTAAFQLFPEQSKSLLEAYGFNPGDVDMRTGRYTPGARREVVEKRHTQDGRTLVKYSDGSIEEAQ